MSERQADSFDRTCTALLWLAISLTVAGVVGLIVLARSNGVLP